MKAYRDINSLKSCGVYDRPSQILHEDYGNVNLIFWELRSAAIDKEALKKIIMDNIT